MENQSSNRPVDFLLEGFSESEIKEMFRDHGIKQLIFTKDLVVFRIGSGEILGQFEENGSCIKATLGHVEGGGEGVLMKIQNLLREFGRLYEYSSIEWVVYAVDCPKPNPKLRKILELKAYEIRKMRDGNFAYYKQEIL